MTSDIQLPEDTSLKLGEASEILGIKKQALVERAILLYLDNLKNYLDLKKELKIWDDLSDEALLNFEKSL